MDVERDITVVVKTFERPDALRRLVASIRRYYSRVAVLVVDDSAESLEPAPAGITRYLHAPYNTLGAASAASVAFGWKAICSGPVTASATGCRARLRTPVDGLSASPAARPRAPAPHLRAPGLEAHAG